MFYTNYKYKEFANIARRLANVYKFFLFIIGVEHINLCNWGTEFINNFLIIFKKKENEKKIKAKEAALKKHKKIRKENYRNLCSKSRSGQIFMGNQVDILLKKIVKNSNN